MDSFENAQEYEKRFLEKYFKTQAQKKIKEIEDKIDSSKSQTQINKLKEQIVVIQKQLDEDLRSIEQPAVVQPENLTDIKEEKCISDFEYNGLLINHDIWNYLYDYQKMGVKWMLDLFLDGKGGILADEMGLGKTVQIVSFLSILYKLNKFEKVLILCPATIVSQWECEFNKIDPNIPVLKGVVAKNGINILSFELFKNLSKKSHFYDLVFLDEGHKIKNKDSQISQLVKTIHCKSRFILTGTPIQNNLSELWSVMDFVAPGLLGGYNTFHDEFESKIKNNKTLQTKEISYQYSILLRTLIEPYILRRMKSEILHYLPSKIDKVVFTNLTSTQHNLYLKAIESEKFKRMLQSKGKLLFAIDILRKICNHPYLISKNFNLPDKISNISENFCQNINCEKIIEESCKMKVLFKFLEKWFDEKRKVLVFSQSIKMLEIIEVAIQTVNNGRYTYHKMTGETNLSKRNAIVNDFNNNDDIFIFLLTTRVGGLGLNLVGASRIIIYDPDWNPSTDNQAKERIYRFGQKSDVEIYRLICRNTIEEKIYHKQIYKDCLSKKILTDPKIQMRDEIMCDIYDYHYIPEGDADIALDDNFTNEFTVEPPIANDNLCEIKEGDKSGYYILKEYAQKDILTGPELIDYIHRREYNLS